ncbi:hypothetical protein VTN00DRAFT_5647 [Thermoascus crustaceus]|uniref:uncharacterized protein n=1 Tax=Thermoascus crustaceus TaxID=5088 RepID=UPI003743D27D
MIFRNTRASFITRKAASGHLDGVHGSSYCSWKWLCGAKMIDITNERRGLKTVAVTIPLLCSSKAAFEPGPPVMGTGAADTTRKDAGPAAARLWIWTGKSDWHS